MQTKHNHHSNKTKSEKTITATNTLKGRQIKGSLIIGLAESSE